MRQNLFVRVDLHDGKRVGVVGLGPLVAPGESAATQRQAIATGRDHVERHRLHPDVGGGLPIGENLRTVSHAGTDQRTVIDHRRIVGQHPGHRAPVASRETRQEALRRMAGEVGELRRLEDELVEPRKRDAEVVFIE